MKRGGPEGQSALHLSLKKAALFGTRCGHAQHNGSSQGCSEILHKTFNFPSIAKWLPGHKTGGAHILPSAIWAGSASYTLYGPWLLCVAYLRLPTGGIGIENTGL